jgi:hypothetical protein
MHTKHDILTSSGPLVTTFILIAKLKFSYGRHVILNSAKVYRNKSCVFFSNSSTIGSYIEWRY